MCGGIKEYRGAKEDIPRPRTAEELRELAQKKQAAREQKSKTNGMKWQGDYLR